MAMNPRDMVAMAGVDGGAGELTEELCWSALESAAMGRLAVVSEGDLDIYPINFVVDGTKIYFRTAPGSKLDALTENDRVVLEIDAVDDAAAYSVIVKGRAERLEAPSEIERAEALPLQPWIPTRKLRWVRIHAGAVTGRAFHRGTEPQSYA